MVDELQLSRLSQRLGAVAAELEIGRMFLDGFGHFSEPYVSCSDAFDDLQAVASALLQAKVTIDHFMDTLPKKQQAVYKQTIESRNNQEDTA